MLNDSECKYLVEGSKPIRRYRNPKHSFFIIPSTTYTKNLNLNRCDHQVGRQDQESGVLKERDICHAREGKVFTRCEKDGGGEFCVGRTKEKAIGS